MPVSDHKTSVKPVDIPVQTSGTTHSIGVSPALAEASRKNGEELLRDLQTVLSGLTQEEAEKRARKVGLNEVARERRQSWPAVF